MKQNNFPSLAAFHMKSLIRFLGCLVVIGFLVSVVETSFAQPVVSEQVQSLAQGFESPPNQSYPETWFHLIGGNVNKEALTKDLEAARPGNAAFGL